MAEPLVWQSASAAEDLLFVGLIDALASIEGTTPREAAIIGGVMVELMVRERAMKMLRATRDVDVGIHVVALRRVCATAELQRRDYERRRGHIFVRESEDPPGESSIDVLVPSYTTRQSRERRIDDLVTIEVGMLAEALTTASDREVRLVTRAGERADLRVPVPHPLGALTLKLSAWEARRAGKDAYDVWRCLEICSYDGLDGSKWPPQPEMRGYSKKVWAASLATLESDGVIAALSHANLAGDDATRRAARIVALGNRVLG